jgi:hypothetical protein
MNGEIDTKNTAKSIPHIIEGTQQRGNIVGQKRRPAKKVHNRMGPIKYYK